jgi:hypothetical protein
MILGINRYRFKMDQQAPNYQLWPQAANVYPAVAQLHYHSVPETPYTLTPAPVTTPISSPLFHPPPLPKEQINITEMFPRLSNPGEIGLRVDVVEDKERKNSPYLVCLHVACVGGWKTLTSLLACTYVVDEK